MGLRLLWGQFLGRGGVTILPDVTLGDNVVAGAGAVVTKSFRCGRGISPCVVEIPVKGEGMIHKHEILF